MDLQIKPPILNFLEENTLLFITVEKEILMSNYLFLGFFLKLG